MSKYSLEDLKALGLNIPAKLVPKSVLAANPVTTPTTMVKSDPVKLHINDKEVRHSYKPLLENMNEIFKVSAITYSKLGLMFQSKTFDDSGYKLGDSKNRFSSFDPNQPDLLGSEQFHKVFTKALVVYGKTDANQANYYVETPLDLEPIECRFGINVPTSDDKSNNNANSSKVLAILKTYLPELGLSNSFGQLELNKETSFNELKDVKLNSTESLHAYTAMCGGAEFAKLAYATYADEAIKKAGSSAKPSFTKTFANLNFNRRDTLINFGFSVDTEKSTVVMEKSPNNTSPFVATFDVTKTTATSPVLKVKLVVNVRVIYKWPLRVACAVTSATNDADFIPYLFRHYLQLHKKYYTGEQQTKESKGPGGKKRKQASIKPPKYISNFERIKNESDSFAKTRIPIKTNPEGFLIIGAASKAYVGDIVWIPDTAKERDSVINYISAIKSAHDPKTGEFVDTNPKADNRLRALRDSGLYLDHYNSRFAYLNSAGQVNSFDLAGSMPLDNITIRRSLLESIVDSNEKNASSTNEDFFTFLASEVQKIDKNFIESAEKANPKFKSLNLKFRGDPIKYSYDTLSKSSDHVVWLNLGDSTTLGYRTAAGDLAPTEEIDSNERDHLLCDLIKYAAQLLLNNFGTLSKAYSNKLSPLRYQLMLITHYGSKIKSLDKEFNESVERNGNNSNVTADVKGIKLYNMPGITDLFPHQAKFFNKVKKHPTKMLLSMAVGAGKSLIGTGFAAQLLAAMVETKVKKVLILCPSRLVRSWVSEIYKYSKGQINAVGLNLSTIRTLIEVVTGDEHVLSNLGVLTNYLKDHPNNTIYIASYDFVRYNGKGLTIQYGDEEVVKYPIAECLRDLGFDMLFADESQYLKNPGNAVTSAAAIIISNVKYTVMASGTVIHNTAPDLTGQFALLNPAIFNSKDKFIAKYCNDPKGNELKLNAEKQIRELQSQYCLREDVKRRDFAYLLPNCHEIPIKCEPTKKQLEFYKILVNKAMQDGSIKGQLDKLNELEGTNLTSDENLEEKQDEVMDALQTRFQGVEEFLCNPLDFGAVGSLGKGFSDSSTTGLREEYLQTFKVGGKSLTEEDAKTIKNCLAANTKVPEKYAGIVKDLVSPKVEAVVSILQQCLGDFLSGKRKDIKGKKVLVFSYRIVEPIHIYENLPPEWKKHARLYLSSSGAEVLKSFMDDDDVWILVAAATSIKEGQNLQVANTEILLQTSWSPGDEEQVIGRIMRPESNVNSTRSDVYVYRVYINNTLEVAKAARMIVKTINKKRYDESDNPEFDKVRDILDETMGKIPLPVMNFENISVRDTDWRIKDYTDTNRMIETWEAIQFKAMREKNLGRLSLTADNHASIPNSQPLAYIPRIPGNSPFGKHLMAISIAEEIPESDLPYVGEGNQFHIPKPSLNTKEATLVDTEFGIGFYARSVNPTTAEVKIPGLPYKNQYIKLPKSTVYVYTDHDEEQKVRNKLDKAMLTGGGIVRVPGKLATPATSPLEHDEEESELPVTPSKTPGTPTPSTPPTKPLVQTPVGPVVTPSGPTGPTGKQKPEIPPLSGKKPPAGVPNVTPPAKAATSFANATVIELSPTILNKAFTLQITHTDDKPLTMELTDKLTDWNVIPGMVYIGIEKPAGIDAFFELMEKFKFTLPEDDKKLLLTYKTNFHKLDKVANVSTSSYHKLITQHATTKGNVVRFYPWVEQPGAKEKLELNVAMPLAGTDAKAIAKRLMSAVGTKYIREVTQSKSIYANSLTHEFFNMGNFLTKEFPGGVASAKEYVKKHLRSYMTEQYYNELIKLFDAHF